MYEKELKEIGFSPNEAKIYEVVLAKGEATVAEIAKQTGIHRRSCYDTLQRLVDKGIIFPIFDRKESLYAAADPDKLFQMVREREKTFKRILPGLEYLKEKSTVTESAFIYRGKEGYKNYLRDRYRVAEDTYFFSAKGNWTTDEEALGLEKDFQRVIKKYKRDFRILFDPRVRENKRVQKTTIAKFKFLPEGFPTPGNVDVFGDYVAIFVNRNQIGEFGDDGLIFMIVSSELAESYRTWFKMVWDMLPKEK